MKKLVQWIIILICWFTLSPLFYYLAKKWKLLKALWRAILLLISPLFWFLYAILFIVSVYLADDMQRRFQFMDHEEIAEITKKTEASIKMTLKRGREELKKEMEGNE